MRHKDEIIETFSVKIIIGGGGGAFEYYWILLTENTYLILSGDHIMRNQNLSYIRKQQPPTKQ